MAARLLEIRERGELKGRKTYPAEMLAGIGNQRGVRPPPPEVAVYDELSRLNNELLTAQRELARKNAQLESLNGRLVEADRRKDEFLAMLAHEIRNPLAPLRNAALLLQQPGVDQPLARAHRGDGGAAGAATGRLVDDLLDLSRIARGKMQLRKEWVDLGQAAGRAAEACRPLVEAGGTN